MAIFVSPIAAPIAGAALLGLGGWRCIYALLAGLGVALLIGVRFGLDEDAAARRRGAPWVSWRFVRDYGRVLSHPGARAYIAATAASFGVVAAYTTGSSLFFIQVLGISPDRYAPDLQPHGTGEHRRCVPRRPPERRRNIASFIRCRSALLIVTSRIVSASGDGVDRVDARSPSRCRCSWPSRSAGA